MAAHEAVKLLAVKAFSHLKGTWRILSKVMWRPDKRKLPSIILASCLLHNIMIDRGDKLHSDIVWPGHHDLGYEEQYCGHVSALGSTMRENLVNRAPVANPSQNKRTADNRSFRSQEVLRVNYLQISRFRLQIFASHFTGSFDTPSLISFITIVLEDGHTYNEEPSSIFKDCEATRV
ncbi:hypothetical protein Cgig2_014264 [Carnegiea gigantea]|uniref:DDE Tnp4 domain-containing protein n=1 Tax=Carnegiea gigantea TaxID=171969 RepID=A0A9Q1K2R2_9CARY|nr:hypothetical protein Cgig2_014264 [Carnegiea gigantea]